MAKRIKSAIKKAEISERNRKRNISVKSALRTAVKKVETGLLSKDENLASNLKDAISKLDRAESKNVLHKNTVARKKSRLMKKINAAAKA